MNKSGPYPFNQALPWLFFITMLFWLNYSAKACLSPLLVSVETDLQIGHTASTSLMFLQSIGVSIALLSSGFLQSRIRPYLVVCLSMLGAGLMLLCMPLVSSLHGARLVFFGYSLFAGLYFPAGMSTLSSLVDLKHLGRAVSIHELAPNLGFIFMPLLAQAGLFFTSWQGVYAIVGGLLFLGGLLFMLFGHGGRSLMAPPTAGTLSRMLRNKVVWALMFILAILNIGEYSVFSILQIFLVNSHGLSPEAANLGMAASRLATPFAVMLGGWLADKTNPYRLLQAGMLVQILALILMCLPWLPLVFTGMIMQAASIAAMFPALFIVISHFFPADQQPMLLSVSLPLSSLTATGLVPLFLGWCGQYLNFEVGLISVAGLTVLGLAGLVSLSKRTVKAEGG